MLDLVIIGPTNSGKGSISYILSMYLGYKSFSIGNLLRKRALINDKLGAIIGHCLKNGDLMANDVIYKILYAKLSNFLIDKSNDVGIIVDGYPRTVNQISDLMGIFSKLHRKYIFFVIDIPLEIAVDRSKNRICCVDCGAIYNTISMVPSIKEGKMFCSKCDSSSLIKRDDDVGDIVRRKYCIQNDELHGIKKYLKTNNILHYFLDGRNPLYENYNIIRNSVIEK